MHRFDQKDTLLFDWNGNRGRLPADFRAKRLHERQHELLLIKHWGGGVVSGLGGRGNRCFLLRKQRGKVCARRFRKLAAQVEADLAAQIALPTVNGFEQRALTARTRVAAAERVWIFDLCEEAERIFYAIDANLDRIDLRPGEHDGRLIVRSKSSIAREREIWQRFVLAGERGGSGQR